MNVLSLFDGISCGQIALERAGIEVANYYASEIDIPAITITQRNYPNTVQLGRVEELTAEKLKQLPKIDLLIGGSPCQGFSRNGKSLNFEDPRSKLFFEYVRILRYLKEHNNPDIIFLLENVHMKKEYRDIISDHLGVQPVDINSKSMSAQNRPRLYWTNLPLTPPDDKGIRLIDILDDVNLTCERVNDISFDPAIPKAARELVSLCEMGIRVKQATKLGYIDAVNGDGINLSFPTSKTRRGRVIKEKSNTLDCSCAGSVYHNGMVRNFTIHELEKLQTLPVDYTEGVSLKDRKHAIGNGWTVDVIAYIFTTLRGKSDETI